MPSIFQLQGPPFGAAISIPSYGSRFIRTYDTSQFSGLGWLGAMPGLGTLLLVGASATAGALGHRWWMKRKRRR